eukprot:5454533-Pyramimonas_sp.AAC.1
MGYSIGDKGLLEKDLELMCKQTAAKNPKLACVFQCRGEAWPSDKVGGDVIRGCQGNFHPDVDQQG